MDRFNSVETAKETSRNHGGKNIKYDNMFLTWFLLVASEFDLLRQFATSGDLHLHLFVGLGLLPFDFLPYCLYDNNIPRISQSVENSVAEQLHNYGFPQLGSGTKVGQLWVRRIAYPTNANFQLFEWIRCDIPNSACQCKKKLCHNHPDHIKL